MCNTTDIYLCQCERDIIVPYMGVCIDCLYDMGFEPIDIDGMIDLISSHEPEGAEYTPIDDQIDLNDNLLT